MCSPVSHWRSSSLSLVPITSGLLLTPLEGQKGALSESVVMPSRPRGDCTRTAYNCARQGWNMQAVMSWIQLAHWKCALQVKAVIPWRVNWVAEDTVGHACYLWKLGPLALLHELVSASVLCGAGHSVSICALYILIFLSLCVCWG